MILGDESLAEASAWADEMRSDPAEFWQKTANPWQYVTVPRGQTYAEVGAPVEGDAASALKRFAATLRDPKATSEQKQLALRFRIAAYLKPFRQLNEFRRVASPECPQWVESRHSASAAKTLRGHRDER